MHLIFSISTCFKSIGAFLIYACFSHSTLFKKENLVSGFGTADNYVAYYQNRGHVISSSFLACLSLLYKTLMISDIHTGGFAYKMEIDVKVRYIKIIVTYITTICSSQFSYKLFNNTGLSCVGLSSLR